MTLLLKSSPSRPTTRSGRGRSSGSSPAPISPSSSNAWRRRRQDGCPKRHEYITEFTCQSTSHPRQRLDGTSSRYAGLGPGGPEAARPTLADPTSAEAELLTSLLHIRPHGRPPQWPSLCLALLNATSVYSLRYSSIDVTRTPTAGWTS